MGTNVVGTIGVGQISLHTYLTARPNHQSGMEIDRKNWIATLRDDCQNVAVLQEYANQKGLHCLASDVRCSLLYACFWHAGRRDGCVQNTRNNDYFDNIVTAHSMVISSLSTTYVARYRSLIDSRGRAQLLQ